MMNTNNNFSAVATSAASVRYNCAVLHNSVLSAIRNSGDIAAVTTSADVQKAVLSAAVACKVLSAEAAASMLPDSAAVLSLTLSAVMGFVSVSVKGTQKENNLRRLYTVKGMGAVKKAVLSVDTAFDVKGENLTIPAVAEKKERQKPRPLSDAEKIVKLEWEIAKTRARMEHTAAHKSDEFKFPTLKEWSAARSEVAAA